MFRPISQRKVACTFDDCSRLFLSVEEMRSHKESEPLHDYCDRCDMDFENEERFLIHKIMTASKHIVCPICGIDFRSEGGRDAHIRQNHRAEQNLVCYGCKSIFKSASGLMRHIEDNDCAVISQTRLLQEQSKKLIIKEALKAGEGESMPVVPLPADLDDVDGGVRVDLLETENRKAMMNQPRPGKDDPTASVDAMLALKHWPNLGEKGPTACEQPASDLMAFSDSGSLSKEEQGSSTLEKSSPGGGGIFNGGLPDAGQTIRLLDDKWDATKFFNSYTGKYTCICSTTFTAMKDFEHHVLMKSKAKRNVQCPGCLRIFKSAAALVAHCESPSVRCDINTTAIYNQFIDEVSGGVIQAAGYHDDGTIRYEAGELSVPKKKTVGVDLQQVDW